MLLTRSKRKARRRKGNISITRIQRDSEEQTTKYLLSKIRELEEQKEDLIDERLQQARTYVYKRELLHEVTKCEKLKNTMEQNVKDWRRNVAIMEMDTEHLLRRSRKKSKETERLRKLLENLEGVSKMKELRTCGRVINGAGYLSSPDNDRQPESKYQEFTKATTQYQQEIRQEEHEDNT
ncbi:uncharacterized protein [Clytia hemisphaerica]|uniref:Uncharacterized protein n=1 Tax=Clytia hemisphaerica TaxID=252671 RepID=A0A7M5TRG6_9CNID|eukprot:TCONS_00005433-protein